MLNSFKSKAPEKDKNATANVAEAIGTMAQPQHSVVEQAAARLEPTTKAGTASCIGSGMSIVGKIECKGPARVFGRIEGEVRASDLLIGDGAQVEGSVIAQDVTVCGRVKGTIRAVGVKLQDGGAVEGDIFHRSLSIDENSQFEGSSRRVENPTELSSSVDTKGPEKEDMQSSALAPYLERVEESASTEQSESTVESKYQGRASWTQRSVAPPRRMREDAKEFSLVVGAIFAVVALFHLARIFMEWTIIIGDWSIPMWASWIALVVAGGLALLGLRLSER